MKIKVSSGIITSANNVDKHIDEISKSITRIEKYLSGVSRVWQGSDATSFVKKFQNEAIPDLRKYVKVMEEYQKYLKEIYPIYKALDDYYNKPIST